VGESTAKVKASAKKSAKIAKHMKKTKGKSAQ